MKQSGWMGNLTMRRVEAVVAKASHLNRDDYGLYQGPKRTYMLHGDQVFDTELAAMRRLWVRMGERYDDLKDKFHKYETEYWAVAAALQSMTKEGDA